LHQSLSILMMMKTMVAAEQYWHWERSQLVLLLVQLV
jgi:hypothetical protein